MFHVAIISFGYLIVNDGLRMLGYFILSSSGSSETILSLHVLAVGKVPRYSTGWSSLLHLK